MPPNANTRAENHLNFVERALELIESSLDKPISVASVCEHVPMSPWQFQRVFKALVGDSIGNYIRGRRLTVSFQKLQNVKVRILDIAIEMQFGSHEAFSRAFKDQFDVSPKDAIGNMSALSHNKTPRITRGGLEHIQSAITREPEIRHLESFSVIGMQDTIRSPLSAEPDFDVKVPELWKRFLMRMHEISDVSGDLKYGIAVSPSRLHNEDEMPYMAALRSEKISNLPIGMQRLTIDGATYAAFEHIGVTRKTQFSIDYIYGIWLPQSNFRRASGFDFETFDERFQLNNKQSVSTMYIPVEPAS